MQLYKIQSPRQPGTQDLYTSVPEDSNYTVTTVTVQYLECETPFHPKAFKIPVL